MIYYRPENAPAPWVLIVGPMWFAYPTLLKALRRWPVLAWGLRKAVREPMHLGRTNQKAETSDL